MIDQLIPVEVSCIGLCHVLHLLSGLAVGLFSHLMGLVLLHDELI